MPDHDSDNDGSSSSSSKSDASQEPHGGAEPETVECENSQTESEFLTSPEQGSGIRRGIDVVPKV